MKSSRFATLAAAGVLAGGLAVSPASAADFGGDCCADLEERVAVLEATTARKGNKKVSLTVSGWVNTGLYIWDDGIESDAYVVSDNGNTLSSRFTFAGSAKIRPGWTAGYNITIEVIQDDNFLGGLNQNNDDNGTFGILYSYMWMKSDRLGTLSWGRQSQATDNVNIVDHSGTLFSGNNVVFRGNTFNIRNGAGGNIATWGQVLSCAGLIGLGIGQDCAGEPAMVIKYETPSISGFSLSASWGENDFWDVALRYSGEFNGVKVGFAVGYYQVDEVFGVNGSFVPAVIGVNNDAEGIAVGASIMHVPTGLFVSGSYEHQDSNFLLQGDADSYYVKAGVKRTVNSLGPTALYFEWAQYNDGVAATLPAGLAGITGLDVTRYGVGLHQWVDAASMQLYLKWDHLELDTDGVNVNAEDLNTFTLGGVIFF